MCYKINYLISASSTVLYEIALQEVRNAVHISQQICEAPREEPAEEIGSILSDRPP